MPNLYHHALAANPTHRVQTTCQLIEGEFSVQAHRASSSLLARFPLSAERRPRLCLDITSQPETSILFDSLVCDCSSAFFLSSGFKKPPQFHTRRNHPVEHHLTMFIQVGTTSSTARPNLGMASGFVICSLEWAATQETMIAQCRPFFHAWFNRVAADDSSNEYQNPIFDL